MIRVLHFPLHCVLLLHILLCFPLLLGDCYVTPLSPPESLPVCFLLKAVESIMLYHLPTLHTSVPSSVFVHLFLVFGFMI